MADNISVLILNKSMLDVGIMANVGFVLGLTAGRLLPNDSFGDSVLDGDGDRHEFLTRIAHHVRKAGAGKISTLRREFTTDADIVVVDYTEAAAPSSYEDYAQSLSGQRGDEIIYRALYVYGPAEKIIPKTKNLSRA